MNLAVKIGLLLVCGGWMCCSTGEASSKPNFIIFYVDDLGYGDLSTYGHPTSFTPNIQNMADNGLILTNFYSNSPVCSPSRSHDIM
ncbi:N-acetylgalactosamine-6-sulfatase [Geodia barretti]|uniref:N-acetylgalactosamine-6-sulfatase n=1 Tax=Geodia barretti TaxID=519541 RepID=A0AA35WP25_GEOBA|nr:N-acetylgalactosamine-6-sulfatase [Geodia barretti]